MPNIRPGWTPKQSVYLRIAAIEFLRVGHTGERGQQWLDMFFDEWLMTQGIPTVPDGMDHAAALAKYKDVSERYHACTLLTSQTLSLFLPRAACCCQHLLARLFGITYSPSSPCGSDPHSQVSPSARSLLPVGFTGQRRISTRQSTRSCVCPIRSGT
jgi:hypothetical protein